MMIAQIVLVLFILAVAILLFKVARALPWIILNSIAGLIVFFLLNTFFALGIDISIWSLLLVGIGGIVGLIAVVLLSLFGVAF